MHGQVGAAADVIVCVVVQHGSGVCGELSVADAVVEADAVVVAVASIL